MGEPVLLLHAIPLQHVIIIMVDQVSHAPVKWISYTTCSLHNQSFSFLLGVFYSSLFQRLNTDLLWWTARTPRPSFCKEEGGEKILQVHAYNRSKEGPAAWENYAIARPVYLRYLFTWTWAALCSDQAHVQQHPSRVLLLGVQPTRGPTHTAGGYT